jgi:DNA topoisomerase-3
MEHAGRFIDDEELKEQLKDGGLCTPATRAAIIERLIKVGYATREKKNLVPTEKGINLISIVPSEIKSPELTGKWEKALNLMAKGLYSNSKFMESIVNYSRFLIEEALKGGTVTFKKETKTKYPVGKCPVCGASVIETSKGWSCSKWKEAGCKFTIWKEDKGLQYFGKKVTASMVKSLLKDGKAQVKGLVNPKTKQKFDRDVVLVHENQYWNIKVDFENTSKPDNIPNDNKPAKNSPVLTEHICPSCKEGHLAYSDTDKFKGWGCEKWKDGCKFSIHAEICGIKTEPYLKAIVEEGHTDIIENFISKKGNTFSARLIVKDGKLEMEFPNKN